LPRHAASTSRLATLTLDIASDSPRAALIYGPFSPYIECKKGKIMLSQKLVLQLAANLGAKEVPTITQTVSGTAGRCHWVTTAGGDRYFLKTHQKTWLDIFAAEHEALVELSSAQCLRYPQPVAHGSCDDTAYLLMEGLDLRSPTERAERRMGRLLARQHRVTHRQFGWHRDNTIGVNAQPNSTCDDWIDFFARHRLRHQLRLATLRGYGESLNAGGERLIERLPEFFADYQPAASLLHGDLWRGNCAMTTTEEPVAFDPAIYFGDREADLAQTLNGGFGDTFYAAYNEEWPIDPGFRHRRYLYNFYTVLNHLNRVGREYLQQTHQYMEHLLQISQRLSDNKVTSLQGDNDIKAALNSV